MQFSSNCASCSPNSIIFSLNGKTINLYEGEFSPLESLAEFLRSDSIHLMGTKIGCNEGGCGSCTVVMSYYEKNGKVAHRSVNSCLIKLIQVHRTTITTIEYLGSLLRKSKDDNTIHPIQNSFIKHSASQCGYCTPGFIMSAYASILNKEEISEDGKKSDSVDIEDLHQFEGNLCRCTGYRSIIDSLREFSKDPNPSDSSFSIGETGIKTYEMNSRIPVVPESFKNAPEANICIRHKGMTFIIPKSLDDLLDAKNECIKNNLIDKTRIIVGSTEISIDLSQNKTITPHQDQIFISSFHMHDLYHIRIENESDLIIGANTPLNDILKFLKEDKSVNKLNSVVEKRFVNEFVKRIENFGSNQIRNVASIIGNICHGGAATDFSNFLLAMQATLIIKDCVTKETVKREMNNSFYVSYRKIGLKPSEIVVEIRIKIPKGNEFVSTFKQGHRRDDDICIVSSTVFASVNKANVIDEIRIAYSGMSACPMRATLVEEFLRGKLFTIENIEDSYKLIDQMFPLNEKTPGGFPQYRLDLAKSFLFRFFHQTQRDRGLEYDKSAADIIDRPIKKSFKFGGCHCKDEKKKDENLIGSSVQHISAALNVTGETVFTDDMAHTINTLYAAFVTSSIPHGKIKSIDFTEALEYPGVVDKVTKDDIRGTNSADFATFMEPVFAEEEVNYIGQPIALIVAKTNEIAKKAAKMVKVTYEELPAVLSVQQAIKENSFFPYDRQIYYGKPESYLSSDDKKQEGINVLSGEMSTNGQNHFYLETTSAYVVPNDEDCLTVYINAQHPALVHNNICRVNNLRANKINVVIKRIGGAFGGKESRPCVVSNAASVAALKLRAPIKLTLDRNTDMMMQGQRNPLYSKYKVAFDNNGIIHALELDYYFDCGWSIDFSYSVCDKALLHSSSAYRIPNLSAKGHLCKTNLVTGTAYRAFGTPQAMLSAESVIEKVSQFLKKNPEDIRYANLFNRDGDKTVFGFQLNGCTVKDCYELLVSDQKFDIKKQRLEAAEFNKNNKYKKIGIAVTPVIYSVGFMIRLLNQGFAHVEIYKDGSVKVFHGGCEMGQGLSTKMRQIAASTLSIPLEKIEVRTCSTDHIPNPVPTSASCGTDLNGGAVIDACQILNERLKKYRVEGKSWEEACFDAHCDQVDLSALGNYAVKDVNFDWNRYMSDLEKRKNGQLDDSECQNYAPMKICQCFSYGCSASKVEVDLLTGDHQILRTDVVVDLGKPINPAVDIGQIEGGLMQGIGYLTLEDVIIGRNPRNGSSSPDDDSLSLHEWLPPGKMLTNGPTFYKVPTINDVPHSLNVSILENKDSPSGILGSKSCSESSFDLALSVPFAILDAVKASKNDDNCKELPSLHFPMSAPRIKQLINII